MEEEEEEEDEQEKRKRVSQNGGKYIHSRERAGRTGVWHGEGVHAQRAATATATATETETETE